jgi:hypothetical protein
MPYVEYLFCLGGGDRKGKMFYKTLHCSYVSHRDHRGSDRMVVGFMTTYAIGAYHR